MTNRRWKRIKIGKYGRVSLLQRVKMPTQILGLNNVGWRVNYWYLDGVNRALFFSKLSEARESQTRFLNGGKL